MHERTRGFFLDQVTRIAELRALRPSSVISIYYDDHTPAASGPHDPELHGIAGGPYRPPYAGGRGRRLPEATLDMDWDLDEPPTQMWAPEHAMAMSPRAAAPRVDRAAPARRPPPTPSSIRSTAGNTGRLYPSSAHGSAPPPHPTALRPRATSTGRARSVTPSDHTGPFSTPAAFAGQATLAGPGPFANPYAAPIPNQAAFPYQTGRHAPSRTGQHAPSRTGQNAPNRTGRNAPNRTGRNAPNRTGRLAPPPPPRDALFPDLAHDSRFYPGLVPAAHELSERDPQVPKRHWLSYVAYVTAALTLAAAGVAGYSLWSTPTTASVVIETTPADASVTIDGRAPAGSSSPYTQEGLLTGEHTLVVQKPGFADYRQTFALAEQEAKRVLFVNLSALAKAEPPAPVVNEPSPPATPQVEPRAAAPVSRWHAKAKAKSASHSGTSAAELAKQHRSELRAAKIAARWRAAHGLPPRETDVADVTEVSRPVHAKKEVAAREPVESYAAEHANPTPRANPNAGTGTLQINSRPWANVFVDGQMVGHTPQMGLSLPAGRHSIKLVNPTMNMSKDLSVTIEAGRTLTKVETLSE
jgi:hypothetical protein